MSRRKQKKRKQPKGSRVSSLREKVLSGSTNVRVRQPELAHPPVHLGAHGTRLAEPYQTLGLDPGVPHTAEDVREAFRVALSDVSPEADPERARNLMEARAYLLDDDQAIARTLGDLRVPDPRHFLPGDSGDRAPSAGLSPTWSSRERLVTLAALYALLEAEIEDFGGGSSRQGELFELRNQS